MRRLARHTAAWLFPLLLAGALALTAGLGVQPGEAQDRTPRAWVPLLARDEPATATPTATPTPPNFTFRRFSLYVDEGEGFRRLVFVGELVNNGSQAVQFIGNAISATYAIGDAPPFAEARGFPYADVIGAGRFAPFVVVLEDAPANLNDLRITVGVRADAWVSPPGPGKAPPAGLTGQILDHEVVIDEESGEELLLFYGTITNESDETYAAVIPVIALYNAEGNVIRVAFDLTVPPSLGPGESGEYVIVFAKAQGIQWADARLFIDAARQ